MDEIKVIYILGSARSGSTLLERLLGTSPLIHNLGEVSHIKQFVEEDRNCSCGERISLCKYWQEVLSNLEGQNSLEVSYRRDNVLEKFKILADLTFSTSLNFTQEFKDRNVQLFKIILTPIFAERNFRTQNETAFSEYIASHCKINSL
jgi:hypothetical protein